MLKLLSACFALALAGCGVRHDSGAVVPDEAAFRLTFGASDAGPADWSGSVETSGGRVVTLAPWRLQDDDSLDLPSSRFQCRTRLSPSGELVPHGLYVTVASAREVSVHTAQGSFSFQPGDVQFGRPVPVLDGRAEVERVPAPLNLTAADQREDGFPAIAFDADADAWVSWVAYREGREQLVVSPLSTKERIVVAEGRFWRPSLTSGQDGTLHLAVSIREGDDWKIATASGRGGKWAPLEAISAGPRDVSPRLAADTHGHLWVTWQGYRDGSRRVLASRNEGQGWGPELLISGDAPGTGEPAIAGDGQGRMHFVWDGYDAGASGIYYRMAKDAILAPVRRIAHAGRHPSVTCDRSDRPWIAWDEARPDQSERRRLRAAVVVGDSVLEPPDIEDPIEQPELVTDDRGNVWCLARRHGTSLAGESAWDYVVFPYAASAGVLGGLVSLPFSLGRNEQRAAIGAAPSGRLTVVWNGDGRTFARPERPVKNEIYAAHIPGVPYGEPQLRPGRAAGRPAAGAVLANEAVARLRDWRAAYRDGELRLARGEVRTANARTLSLRDLLQESRDTGNLDFLALVHPDSDVYQDWLAETLGHIASVPDRFAVLWARPRDSGLLLWANLEPVWKPAPDAAGTPLERLHAYLRSSGGISAVAGQSAPAQADHDPSVEPLVLGGPDAGAVWPEIEVGVLGWTAPASAHRTYAFVLAPDLSPDSLIEALRARHTYAATSPLLLDFRLGDALPGDTVESHAPMTVRVAGTGPVARVELLRDGKPVHTIQPRRASADTSFLDRSGRGQAHRYQVRVEQADGHAALSSPIWVRGR